MAFTLTVEAGPQAGQVFTLEAKAVLGRGQFADVQINDLAVSRRHAEIEPEADGWQFRDLDSANGTRCNGRPLQAPIRLGEGDLIELGQTRLRVRLGEPLASTVAVDAALETIRPPAPPAPFPPKDAIAPMPRTAAIDEPHLISLPRLQALIRLGTLAAAAESSPFGAALALLAECFPRCQRFAWFGIGAELLASRGVAADDWAFARRCCTTALQLQTPLSPALRQAGPAPDAGAIDPPAAWAALPLRLHGRLLGTVYLDSSDTASAIRAQDQGFLEGLSGALAVLMLPVATGQESPQSKDSALLILRMRQLPANVPKLPGYGLALRPGDQAVASAERYDFLQLADGRLAVLLCNPLIPGIAAEILLARLGAYARALAPRARTPADLLGQLNRLLRTEFGDSNPVAASVSAIDPATHRVHLASAAQALPWVLRGAEGASAAVLEPGPALGQSGQLELHEALIELAPGAGFLQFGKRFDAAIESDDDRARGRALRSSLAQIRSAEDALALLDRSGLATSATVIAIWRD